MKTIELNDDDWARLKRKLTHGNEYITYEKEGYEDDSESDN